MLADFPGKLGDYRLSHDGSRLAFTAAASQSDHSVSSLFLADVGDKVAEANYTNGWISRYADPGQAFCTQGFGFFFPNYIGSTGRCVSFGGYAATWLSTVYSDRLKAAVSFVGVSDQVSKRFTTDIPFEDIDVHMGKPIMARISKAGWSTASSALE